MNGMHLQRTAIGALVAFTALVILAPGVRGESPTPEEYTDLVEPVCKKNVIANKQIFRGTKGKVKRGELRKAARDFFRASRAFGRTIREIAAVPRPAGYETRLGRWLKLLRDERAIIQKIGQALAAGKRAKAESHSVELNRNTNKANNAVLSLGFDYCRLESSRFG